MDRQAENLKAIRCWHKLREDLLAGNSQLDPNFNKEMEYLDLYLIKNLEFTKE